MKENAPDNLEAITSEKCAVRRENETKLKAEVFAATKSELDMFSMEFSSFQSMVCLSDEKNPKISINKKSLSHNENGDGEISYQRIEATDINNDGKITPNEISLAYDIVDWRELNADEIDYARLNADFEPLSSSLKNNN